MGNHSMSDGVLPFIHSKAMRHSNCRKAMGLCYQGPRLRREIREAVEDVNIWGLDPVDAMK